MTSVVRTRPNVCRDLNTPTMRPPIVVVIAPDRMITVLCTKAGKAGSDLCYRLKVLRKHAQSDQIFALKTQFRPQNEAIAYSFDLVRVMRRFCLPKRRIRADSGKQFWPNRLTFNRLRWSDPKIELTLVRPQDSQDRPDFLIGRA